MLGSSRPVPRACIFDFDGVILESTDIKTEAFLELFADQPEHLDAILQYHLDNQGISRYQKFEWIYSQLLRRPLDAEQSRRLGSAFSEIVLQKILACPFVPGAYEVIEELHSRFLLFVASGTPQEELEHIVESRGLSTFFTEIWGTPLGKVEIIRSILERYELSPGDVLLVGDGTSDHQAAIETGVPFFARTTPRLDIFWKSREIPGALDLCSLSAFFQSLDPSTQQPSVRVRRQAHE